MKKSQEKGLTVDLKQSEIVTVAVFLLGGDQRAVDTEDAAVKAHELAPGRFAWKKYPEQINLELVRVYLSAAKKADRGGYLSGSGRTGWSLTQNGLAWARRTARTLEGANLARKRERSQAGSIDENRWRRERSRILATDAWVRWVDGDRNPPPKEAAEVFRIDSYAVGQLRETKITRLRSLFDEDDELGPFIARMSEIVSTSEE